MSVSRRATARPAQALPAVRSDGADAEALFAEQCALARRIEPGRGVFALVVDAAKRFGLARSAKQNRDGTQSVVLRVAFDEGGFFVVATTRLPGKPHLKPGDAVLWVPIGYDKTFGTQFADHRTGWIGYVEARVMPASGTIHSFEVVERYA